MHIGIAGPIYLPSINLKYTGDRHKWPVGMGGVPVNHLINALLELGHHVSVFSSSPEIKVGDSFEWHEENISIYMGPRRKRTRHLCSDFFAVERNYIKNVIAKAKPDLVHVHWQYEWAWGALDSGFPTLVTCHDSPWHVLKAQKDLYRLFRLIMALIVIKKASHLTTVSEYCAKGLQLLTSKEIKVIPNFEPDDVFNLYQVNRVANKRYCIAMVNNGFTTRKNVEIGIEAFVRLRDQNPDIELHLFGSSFAEGEEAHEWSRKHFPLDNIYFQGAFLFSDLMKRLSVMDVFLHTSIEESFGMVLVEAMAMGIPVIAGKSSGGPQWILNEGGGLLVDITNIDDVKDALQSLLETDRYNKLSLKAREVAVSRFGKDNVVGQYIDAYKALLP